MGKVRYDYFEGFAAIAKLATDSANFLNEAMTEFNYDDCASMVEKMHKIENAADACKHEMIEKLAHEFITVIEREDIVALAQELDTVLDSIDDVMRRVYMYNVRDVRPETLEFTALIMQMCTGLEEVVAEFKNFKKSNSIAQKIIKVNTLENSGDALHFKYTRKLFAEETDNRAVFVWTNLFEALEQCFDACEHVVDIIESVVMKNT